MQSATRKNLKQDKFATFAEEQIHWTVEHRDTVIRAVIVLALIAAAAIGFMLYNDNRNDAANTALGEALQTYDAILRAPGTPETPNVPSFTSAKDRAVAAHTKFEQIAKDFSLTKSGKMALYLAGVSALESGDTATGESELKQAASSWNGDVAALAHFALANHYRDTKKEQDAITEYNAVIQANRTSVPKTTAQLELAAFYESEKKVSDAMKIYEDVQKEGTTQPEKPKTAKEGTAEAATKAAPEPILTPAAQTAKAKIEMLKKSAATTPAPSATPAPAAK